MFYYAEKSTKATLLKSDKTVYLIGGFAGYNNFGDILQLKNTLLYHKNHTKLTPVVVLFLKSLEGSWHVKQLKQWFDNENFIFLTEEAVDASDAGLQPVKEALASQLLHVYGGGFLNKHWGAQTISLIESVLTDFKISKYIFSGQQVDRETLPSLSKLFKTKQPEIFGLRDEKSLKLISEYFPEINAGFSFDDIAEIFERWGMAGRSARSLTPLGRSNMLAHVNLSSYAAHDSQETLRTINQARATYPKTGLVLAHAYNDRRQIITDSLESVIEYDNDFPFVRYEVINLAKLSLEHQKNRVPIPLLKALLSVKFAVTASYHTAMLMSFFNIPVYLIATNDFYKQKQKALGYPTDFSQFLASPQKYRRNFMKEMKLRKQWLSGLPAYFRESSGSDRELVVLPRLSGKAKELQYRNKD